MKTTETHRIPQRQVVAWTLLSIALWAFALSGCTETSLYSPSLPRKEANRLALSGRVCTEDPVEARFPVRLVILADQAAGPLFAEFDPAGQRNTIMRGFVQSTLNDPDTAVAVVGYAGRARKLAPTEGDFTRNPSALFNAINQLSLPEACLNVDQCRDLREGLRTARTLIEGDLARQPAGVAVLTQYVVLIVAAGFPVPVAMAADCCSDVQCVAEAGDSLSRTCEAQILTQDVVELREAVEAAGAAGLRVHAIHFGAEGVETLDDAMQAGLEQITFAGGGVYQRFNNIGGLTASSLELLNLRTVLGAKVLVASNLNALPTSNGPISDSDADGMGDDEEGLLGTDPTSPDTDQDGIGDLVEVLTGFNPFEADDPTACLALERFRDQDLDGLTDCDEALLGTEDTLVDSDGDGMSDRLEMVAATDYLNRDTETDTDGDGVSNGEEIRQHSDPRSTDAREHLSSGYRYELYDEGFVREQFANKLIKITGVEISHISAKTTPGLGTLTYLADERALRWQDNDDLTPGPPVFVDDGPVLQLNSSSYAPVQGENGKFLVVTVTAVDLPPTGTTSESVQIIYRDRQCIDYTVRNIQLMTTVETERNPVGTNEIFLYFAQSPEGKLGRPGPFRMARIPVIFDPPRTRDPDDAIINVVNEEFVRPQIRAITDAP